jgi:hypothetical protein
LDLAPFLRPPPLALGGLLLLRLVLPPLFRLVSIGFGVLASGLSRVRLSRRILRSFVHPITLPFDQRF